MKRITLTSPAPLGPHAAFPFINCRYLHSAIVSYSAVKTSKGWIMWVCADCRDTAAQEAMSKYYQGVWEV